MGWSRRSLPVGAFARHTTASLLAAFVLLASPGLPHAADAEGDRIELSTQAVQWNPKDRSDFDAGKLEWAGGIEIKSPSKDFGGWSGISISADGSTLLAISDLGKWMTAQLLYDEKGRISGMGDARIAPMLGRDGKPIEGKELADAEGLVVDGTNPLKSVAYVSFERHHRVWRYDLHKDGFDARPAQILTQRQFGRLSTNAGIEALTILRPAEANKPPRLLLVTENTRDPRGNVRAFITEGRAVKRLSFRLHDPYHPTDIARLPDGDLLVLERRFSLLAGAGMQIRRIRKEDIKPNAIVDGEVLLEAGRERSVDNMEGLSIRQDQRGNVWVYVMSDDNRNPLQRTLLVMFRLKSETVMPHHTQGTAESTGEASGSAQAAPAPKQAE
ncbi:MAG: esterase-like activity of phytase family protein [Parvibaculum sp.]|uniref:esterase-like activity of phytase family protein n=1 Tax=Parvibaculum sp. TaxID=2024848 RepID=UPI003C7264BA